MLEKIVVVVVEMDDGKNIWQKVFSLCSPPKVDDNHLDDRSCAAEHFHQLIVLEICERETIYDPSLSFMTRDKNP